MERNFDGIFIPAWLYLETSLSWTEKILIIEINSLDKDGAKRENGDDLGCYASNQYLAKFVGIQESSMANMISKLKKAGWITQLWFDGRNRGLRSKLYESRLHKKVKASEVSQKSEHSKNKNKEVLLKEEETTTTRENDVIAVSEASTGLMDAHENLRNFPILERAKLPLPTMNEIAEIFSNIVQHQNRRTLAKENEWLDCIKQLEKEGMSFDGIKSLYRYGVEIEKKEFITPKMMTDYLFPKYKQYLGKLKQSAEKKRLAQSEPTWTPEGLLIMRPLGLSPSYTMK